MNFTFGDENDSFKFGKRPFSTQIEKFKYALRHYRNISKEVSIFYPGPSKIHPSVSQWASDGIESGVIASNHRSEVFHQVFQELKQLAHEKLNVPKQYGILIVSSATECWDILARSFKDQSSCHIFNGAFGEKWFEADRKVNHTRVNEFRYQSNKSLSINAVRKRISKQPSILCLTHTETSNGTVIPDGVLKALRRTFNSSLICQDATSAMGGIDLPWLTADIWYASVQKCFGLPSGAAVLVYSPRVKKFLNSDSIHYNDLSNAIMHAENYETTHTPNILSVYLLKRLLNAQPNAKKVERQVKANFRLLKGYARNWEGIKPLISNHSVQSSTVVAFKADKGLIQKLHVKAKEAGIVIGKGYGEWKPKSFRLANFPAIEAREIDELNDFMLGVVK